MFKKYDEGKPKLSMIPIDVKAEVAKVLEFGADKYGRDNWSECEDSRRYIDAALRHIDAYVSGEILDKESGRNHLAHAITNLMFVYEIDKKKKGDLDNFLMI